MRLTCENSFHLNLLVILSYIYILVKHPASAGFPSPSGGVAPWAPLFGAPLAPTWETIENEKKLGAPFIWCGGIRRLQPR